MQTYRVEFSPSSNRDLEGLYDYVAKKRSFDAAIRYTEAVMSFCCELGMAPHRGMGRNNVRPGIRVIGFQRRVGIHFRVSDRNKTVTIVRILYGGRTDRRE